MKKKLYTLVFALLAGLTSLDAQSGAFCGQQIISNNILEKNPHLKKAYLEKINVPTSVNNIDNIPFSLKTLSQKNSQSSATPSYTIPLVFHILHLGGPENISDAQVIDQVAILNRDYQKQNADTNLIAPSFTNNIANIGIAFKLATIDPNGNCTNGIIRHYTNMTNWDTGDLNDFIYSWPTDKYLNIYIVKTLNIAATAYAFLPGTPIPTNADVIVSMHNMVGSIGTGNVANSRVLTHEVGHWLNLQHIWGTSNQPGVTCGDDAVSDTPITKGFVSCSIANAAICNPPIQENPQNYMDYSPCKIMFTNGQALRMITCLTGTLNNRQNISSPNNLANTGITTSTNNCMPLIEIATMPSQTLCAGNQVVVNSYTSNANPNSISWIVNNGAIITNSTASSATVMLVNTGNSTINCVATNSAASVSSSLIVTAISGSVNYTSTYQESFETNTLPLHWVILNPTSLSSLWSINNIASSLGNQCIYVNGEVAPANSEEILETPSFDLLNNPNGLFTFKYAYARKTNSHNDIFKVQASKDCGGSWLDIYAPSAAQLASGSGGVDNNLFVPNNSQWKFYDLTQHPSFYQFQSETNVRFRFYFKEGDTGFGNRFYLDEVNFTSPSSITEHMVYSNLKVFPNPATELVNINFNLDHVSNVTITMHDLSGKQLFIIAQDPEMNQGEHHFSSQVTSLSKGVYFIELNIDGYKVVKKVILS